jgi:hypothetical protein
MQAYVDDCFQRIVYRLRCMGHDVVVGVEKNTIASIDGFCGQNSHDEYGKDDPLVFDAVGCIYVRKALWHSGSLYHGSTSEDVDRVADEVLDKLVQMGFIPFTRLPPGYMTRSAKRRSREAASHGGPKGLAAERRP